jgi:UDP-glucose 4-epimerase
MEFNKILVTGGAGFIGSYLVEELLKKGKEVIVFDNGFRSGFLNIKEFENNLSLIKGDVTNYDDWEKIPKDIDIVFHLAAINGTKYFYEIPEKVLEVNVQGTLNLVKWMKNTSVKRIFLASSSEVYGFPQTFPTSEQEPLVIPDPKNPRFSYSSSKMIGETIVINFAKNLGIDYTIARFHNVYGPHMGFEHVMPEFIRKCVKNEQFLIQGNGTDSRSFCYILDAINGILLISTHDDARNEIFNIGTSEEISISDLIKSLEKIHGRKIIPIPTNFENSGTSRRLPDITKLTKLGYAPKFSLSEGLEKTYFWYKKYYENNFK